MGLLLLATLALPAASSSKDDSQLRAVVDLAGALRPWSGVAWDTSPDALAAYRAAYGIQIPADCVHRAGLCDVGSWRIAVQRFTPPQPRARVLLIHGYMDHAAVWRYVVAALLAKDCEVVLCDLPGHGLSSGQRVAIDDFAEYRRVIRAVLQFCQNECAPSLPLSTIGHSTGAGVLADLLLSGTDASALPELAQVVLLAPLCRSAHWELGQWGAKVAGRFVDSLPRRYVDNSSLPGYAEWVRRDPLQYDQLPLCWPQAMGRWHDDLQQREPAPASLRPLLIQGDADAVVDWKYNLAFFRRKFPGLETHMVPGAKHQLMNEEDALRADVIAALLSALER
ncbi:MAG: alpha/beta hydrolase [Lentisphaeria bacterium]|nr:alpha/beta hydrolase [Lentisphaeria bacterium]